MSTLPLKIPVVLIGVLALQSEAAAQLDCSRTGQTQSYKWLVGDSPASDIPIHPVTGTLSYRRYDNQQKHRRYVLANTNVTFLGLNFDYLRTESNYDFLRGSGEGGGFELTGS